MQPSFRPEKSLLIPSSSLTSENNINDLADYCRTAATGTNYIVLASATISKRRLIKIKDKLSVILKSSNIEFVDIWHANFVVGGFQFSEKERREEIKFEDRYFRYKSIAPSFEGNLRRSKWVVDVHLEPEGRKSIGFIPPKFSELNQLLSGKPEKWTIELNRGYRIRLSNENLSYRVDNRTEFFGGLVPSNQEIFESLFKSKGYSALLSDKCRYTQSMISLMGDLEEAKVFRSNGLRDLLFAMRDGTAYTPKEMLSFLKPGSLQKDIERTYDLITQLALKSFFLRGCKIQCPTCDLTRWYPIHDIEEKMQCAGCLNYMQPSVEAPFRYKLNELIARGVDQGSMPVLLTLLFLKNLSHESFIFTPGLIANKIKDTDVDITAACDGNLILCECKDLKQFSGNKLNKELHTQLLGIVEIAKDIDASIVFLSTLLPHVPADLSNRINLLNKRLKDSAVIYLLTSTDLERGYKAKPHPSDLNTETEYNLYDFLPRVQAEKSGWIKEPGSRTIAF